MARQMLYSTDYNDLGMQIGRKTIFPILPEVIIYSKSLPEIDSEYMCWVYAIAYIHPMEFCRKISGFFYPGCSEPVVCGERKAEIYDQAQKYTIVFNF